jgi:Tfp pilus assembly protein PilO
MTNATPHPAPGAIQRPNADTRNWLVHAGGAALALVAGLVLYVGVVAPVQDKHRQANADRAELDRTNHDLAAAETQVVSATRSLEDIRSRLSHAVALKDQRQINRRISELTTLATESGIALTDVQPGRARSAGRYDVVPIKLAGKGTYPTTADFLSRLHAQLRDMDVHGLEVRSSRIDDAHDATITLELAWHTLPAGSARASADRAESADRAARNDRGGRADQDDLREDASRDDCDAPSRTDRR